MRRPITRDEIDAAHNRIAERQREAALRRQKRQVERIRRKACPSGQNYHRRATKADKLFTKRISNDRD